MAKVTYFPYELFHLSTRAQHYSLPCLLSIPHAFFLLAFFAFEVVATGCLIGDMPGIGRGAKVSNDGEAAVCFHFNPPETLPVPLLLVQLGPLKLVALTYAELECEAGATTSSGGRLFVRI